jgi:1-acyl-sn-glycerol-3-phosphate acyltransferase
MPLSFFSRGKRTIHRSAAVPWARTILWGNSIRVNVQGLEALDTSKAYVFIPNHSSFFDIFVLLASLPVDFKFIFKEEIMRVPILGSAMKRAGYISIARSSPAKSRQTIKNAIEMAKEGTSLVIFAEGTRSTDGRLQPLKRGAFQLALGSGCPIVPVAIKGTHSIMPKGNFTLRKGAITMQLGSPIPTADYTRHTMPALLERVTASLREMLGEEETGEDSTALKGAVG